MKKGLLFIGLLCLLLVAACSSSSSDPLKIDSVTLARDDGSGNAGDTGSGRGRGASKISRARPSGVKKRPSSKSPTSVDVGLRSQRGCRYGTWASMGRSIWSQP